MKKISYPPMIIFLDILFVFLFLLILNNNRVMDIELPSGKLISGAELVYKLQGKYYTLDNQEYKASRNFIYIDKCNNRIDECKKYSKDIFIIYPKKLQEDIANLSILALGNNTCKKIKFIINVESKLDYKKMLNENTCLKKIKDYETLIK